MTIKVFITLAPGYWHSAQVSVVRLVLVGHEEEHQPVGELFVVARLFFNSSGKIS